MEKATTTRTSVEPSRIKDFERSPAGGIMKEEEPMLQNQNPATPTITSHKNHLIKSDITAIASTPHKRNTPIIAAVDDCDKERFEPETVDAHRLKTEENTAEEAKGEERSMSSSLCGGRLKEESGWERLKRHRVEVAGQIWIPDTWGQEDLLKDWIECSAFDSALVPKEIMSAITALAEEGRRALSGRLGVENSC